MTYLTRVELAELLKKAKRQAREADQLRRELESLVERLKREDKDPTRGDSKRKPPK